MSISFQIVDWYTENYDKRENENLKDGKDEYYDDEPSDNEEYDSDNEGGRLLSFILVLYIFIVS